VGGNIEIFKKDFNWMPILLNSFSKILDLFIKKKLDNIISPENT